ncbi:MAG: DivIVA domain-containing protein [Oscillospiraceae bacterium]|nr:DivIVA domain-containing protein [Oscillospiraceae bacterium]
MFTPQQIEQISFGRATFGGYDMQAVDEFLEPLTEDYVTLYKENALLKSKMRVLVGKLEEYRKNEASMKDAIVNAQKTCDKMVKEAEAKCTQMLNDANAAAAENAKNADALIAAENARVEEAKKAAAAKIEQLQDEIRSCIQALERIKEANRPLNTSTPSGAFDFDRSDKAPSKVDAKTEAVANEIAANLEALVGTTEEPAPKAEPQHPVSDTTSKFANLQFGRNYDPTHK